MTCTEMHHATMQTLDEPGEGRVLIVDGQASMRCALLGDILGAKLHKNGFSVRDPRGYESVGNYFQPVLHVLLQEVDF
jgi:hypothetical protein